MATRRTEEAPDQPVTWWLNELAAARKRETDFRKDGRRVREIYSGRCGEQTPFNILFSNTETLLPALYSAIPRPVVTRRFKDADPLGKAAAEAAKRALEFLLDTNEEGYETFDDALRAATLDALLPGRAVTAAKYDATVVEMPEEGAAPDAEPMPYTQAELVCLDTKAWDRVLFGYAKKWSQVPWVAYEEQIDRKEATRLFGREVAAKLIYTDADREERRYNADAAGSGGTESRWTGERKLVTIYQIWDKDGGRVIRYVCEQYRDGFLKVEADPLGLTGFFNCPRPLRFLEQSADLMPTAPYLLYENQAKELNELTRRISKITKAIKARGIYDGELGGDLANVMNLDDNELVAAERGASIAAEKGIGNAIWFMPLEQLVGTLAQLTAARGQCKQTIYEITGIADIMRGASQASETLGAQQIKQSWGTLRLKRLQREVQRYCRDLMRMMVEIAALKLSEETWAKMTGLPFATTMQLQQAQQMMQAAQMMGQPPDPRVIEVLQQPTWFAVLDLLRDDLQRAYRIDIETNSTVEPEAVDDQKQITELMTAMGQYLNGVTPLVTQGVLPFGAAQGMLLAISRRFRFGSEVETYIQEMQAPQPKPDEGAQAQQAEQQRTQMEMQVRHAELQQTAQLEAAKLQQAQADLQLTLQVEQLRQEAARQAAQVAAVVEQTRQAEQIKADRAIAQMQAQMTQTTEIRKSEIAAAAQIQVAEIRAAQAACKEMTHGETIAVAL